MKLLKVSSLLLAGLIVTSTASAQNLIAQTNSPTNVVIHTMNVINSGDREVTGQVTLNVGLLQGNTCMINRSFPAGSFPFHPHTNNNALVLYGDNLAHQIGLGFSCMDIVTQTDKLTSHDTFKLYNDGSIYSATAPNYDTVTVN